MEQAAGIVRRSKEAAGAFEPTKSYKRGQIEELIGFAYNSRREFCAVLTQPHIQAEREATEDEIAEYMQALGFEMDYIDEFHNEQYEVFDAVPNNVLYGIDGDLYFIDTQISRPENKGRNVGIVISGLLTGILASRVIIGFVGEVLGWREMYFIAAFFYIPTKLFLFFSAICDTQLRHFMHLP